MQINISGHHVELTPALREYVASKLGRLERHGARILHADVVLNVEKLRQKVEADPSTPRHVLTEPGVGYRLV